jgi:hypothetical protein
MTGNASCSVWDLHSAEVGVELIIGAGSVHCLPAAVT